MNLFYILIFFSYVLRINSKNKYQNSTSVSEKTYTGNFIYNNEGLEYALLDKGRLTPQTGGNFDYEYFLKDHLGNTRVVFTDVREQGLTILQQSHYYPFGMEFMGTPSATMTVENFYKYNGKELQSDGFDLDSDASGILESRLLWYDYGARFMMRSWGGFTRKTGLLKNITAFQLINMELTIRC